MLEQPPDKRQGKYGTSVVSQCHSHSQDKSRNLTIESPEKDWINRQKKTPQINAKSEKLRARFDPLY